MYRQVRVARVVALVVIGVCRLGPPALAQDCPELVGRWPHGGTALAVAVSGTTAYLGSGSLLLVLDVSDPAAPFEVGSMDTPGRAVGVAVAGSYAYVADAADLYEWHGGLIVSSCEGLIFQDGFESGDTSAWSATVP